MADRPNDRRAPDPLRRKLLRRVFEQSEEFALVLLDEGGRIVGWEMGAQNLFGYTRSEAEGAMLDLIFAAEDRAREEPRNELNVARKVGKARDDRWQRRKDGSHFWANGFLFRLHDDDGKTIGFAKVLRDRSDVRQQIELLTNRLAAQEKAKQNRTLALDTLTHELRSPLSAIKNAVAVLQMKGALSEETGSMLRVIDQQADFMRDLTDDLFDLARMGAGKVTLHESDFDLRVAVERAMESCSGLMAPRHQVAEILFPEKGIPIRGDLSRLQQVFANLVSNASKFSSDGGCIWITGTVEADEAVVKVADAGKGIAPDMLHEIFSLFTQAEPLDTALPPGLGIGLSLAKDLVTLHGGSIQARSEGVGKGSAFIVRLPLQPREQGGPARVGR